MVGIMSVSYRSWEVVSGPIVGFNMAIQSNMCTPADTLIPTETPNYCSNTVLSHESLMKAVAAGTDVSKGLTFPNHISHTQRDLVIRGLSSLSLHAQPQHQARSPSEDCKISPSCESGNKSVELKCNVPLPSSAKNFCCFAACSAGYHTHGKSAHHDDCGFKGFEDVSCCVSTLQPLPHSSDVRGSISPNSFWVATRNYIPLHDVYGDLEFYDFPKHTLDVVVEDKPFEENVVAGNDELEIDALSTLSTNSVSSLLDSAVDGSVSSGEKFHGAEAQTAFEGSSTCMGCSSPPRKGLSRFYAGKSRSFSCLGDVMSLKDLAKPENPYAKRRRCHTGRGMNSGRPQLPPLQKGANSISKKGLNSGKSTLALAVTMSTMEEAITKNDDDQSFPGTQMSRQNSALPSRSYSLSDLQRATKGRVSSC